jgi:drug/metabolite transporter (DMT)-like permease
MDLSALVLVLIGALLHALWNYSAKKAAGGASFVWLYGVVSMLLAMPLVVIDVLHNPRPITAGMWSAVMASSVLHVAYSLVLQRGYQAGDFSVVYPVARGTGPLLSVFGAILVLGEMPTRAGWTGIGAILAGIFMIAGGARIFFSGDKRVSVGLAWGIVTGLFIAAYTVVDGWAIKSLGMSPVLYYGLGLMLRTVLLAPTAMREPQLLRAQWHKNRRHVITVGALSPLAYLLVLFALTRAPLSYVAPVRELSMLIGAFIGSRILGEKSGVSRMIGTALMVGGVVMLARA